jgi:acyl carrier protein
MGLDIVELVMTVEETFDIEIPDRDAERLRTVGDLYWYLREHAPDVSVPIVSSRPAVPNDEVWERLLDVIEKETGIDRARLTPAARFVDDLGLD